MKIFQLIFAILILTFWIGCENGSKSKSTPPNTTVDTSSKVEINENIAVGALPPQNAPKIEENVAVTALPPTRTGGLVSKTFSIPKDKTLPNRASKNDLGFGIDKYIKKMKRAKMMFNPPQEMMVNSTHVMKLVIDLSKSFEKLKENFKHNATLSKREVKVSDLIEVKLSGTAFKIDPITPEKQHISKIETTTWEWSVTPQKVGQQDLQLVVTAIFTKGNGKQISRLKTFDETIKVKSLPLMQQVINFFSKEYKWLFATFFIPIFLWFIKKRKRTKE